MYLFGVFYSRGKERVLGRLISPYMSPPETYTLFLYPAMCF